MTSIGLSDVHTFAAIARLRSFRKASVELGLSPSALSHSMRVLETRLGVRLLHRTTRSVAPTAAGTLLLTRVQPALHAIEDALDALNDFRDTPLGTVRISAPKDAAQLVLGDLVNRFLKAYPGMRVELVSEDRLVDIVTDGFDAGVRFGERLQQDMVAMPLGGMQRFVVVASPAFLAVREHPIHPADLQQHPCVRIQFPSGMPYRWEFSKDQERLEVEVDGPLALGDMQLMVAAAQSGLGFAYVYHQHAAAGLADGSLCTVLSEWCPAVPGFFLYYPSRRQMTAGFQAFVQWIRSEADASTCAS